MYFKSILPTVALCFLATSSANAAPREPQETNQILVRSAHLSLRQATGDSVNCDIICYPAESKADACGYSEACQCGPAVSGPLLDCAQCAYKHTTNVSLRNEIVDAFNEYVDACKDAGHPVEGDTSVSGSPSVWEVSSSSAGSSTSNAKSVTNGAISRSAAGLALHAVVVAVFGFMV